MAATVANIITQVKAIALAELGSTYQELRFVYDLPRNDMRGGKLGYGVHPGAATENADVSPINYYTLDHTFSLVLTDTVARNSSSDESLTVIQTMFNKLDEIYQDMVNTKINLASTVLTVGSASLSEPEFFLDNKLIAITMEFVVRYRQSL